MKEFRQQSGAKYARQSRCRGLVSVLALMFLVIFASLVVAYGSMVGTNLAMAENQEGVLAARMEAESGLTFGTYLLRQIHIPAGATGEAMASSLAEALSTSLGGSSMLGGGSVMYDADTGVIVLPAITSNAASRNFTLAFSLVDADTVTISSTGRNDSVTRRVSMEYDLGGGSSGIFNYGVAARGPIRMTGNAHISGANDPNEANMLSAATSDDSVFDLTGNCDIDGDIYMTDPNAAVSLSGNISIGGTSKYETDPNGDLAINEHIHIGIEDVEFPEVDPTVFEPYATNIVNGSTSTSGNKTFNNIRIAAGTNPTFAGNITLNGVIYVEVPNTVKFTGNLNINGVIITEDAGDDTYEQNTLKFTGNTTVKGVETLPDTAEFSELRQMPGSFLLAPGFGVEFTGNFGTVSGAIAAEKFKFTGNAGGIVHGPVISYGPEEFKLTGNASLQIDREESPDVPPGFACPSTLAPNPGTYKEY